MAKAKLKNDKTEASVKDFLDSIKDTKKQQDSKAIVELMQKVSGEQPKMWGSAIVGFGDVHLKYESGRELDWFKIGFSPRKQNIALYGLLNSAAPDVLEKLGKHSSSKGCLYINTMSDIDKKVFQKIIEQAWKKKK